MRILKTIFVILIIIQVYIVKSMADDSVEDSGRLTETASGRTVLVIQGSHNLSGSIRILPLSGDQIDVTYRRSATAESESQARRFLDLVDLKLVPTGQDQITLSILTPSDAPWQGSDRKVMLDIFIQLPEKMKIDCDMRFMKLDINGPFSEVKTRAGFSELNIEGIRGPVDITTSFAAIKLGGITGNIRAETRYAPIEASDITIPLGSAIFQNAGGVIKLRNISGPVEAYTSYSGIDVKNIDAADGSMVFRTSYSPITATDISGELICETSFSPVDIVNASLTHGQSKIETSYSPINAEFREIDAGQLFVYNNYNNINLSIPSTVSSQIIASVDDGGRIHSANLPIKPTHLDATRLEGELGGGQARIELKVSGIGIIDIKGR
jgi:hypothetical protein